MVKTWYLVIVFRGFFDLIGLGLRVIIFESKQLEFVISKFIRIKMFLKPTLGVESAIHPENFWAFLILFW